MREDYVLFVAPERCPAAPQDALAAPTATSDVWSLGVLMALLAQRSLPMLTLPLPVRVCVWVGLCVGRWQ